MTPPRQVDPCPFRARVTRRAGQEFAECRLVSQHIGPVALPRAACEACCKSSPPGPGRLNEVIGSFVFSRAARARRARGVAAAPPPEREVVRRQAEGALRVVWHSPNRPNWCGSVDAIGPASTLIDPAITPDTLAAHIRRREPFSHPRYGDGEWRSMLGANGHNSDGHVYLPGTLGKELRRSLEYFASLGPEVGPCYVGLHAGRYQPAIRRHLVEANLAHRIHWAGDMILMKGIRNLATLRFLLAVIEYPGPKVLVANETLAPVAQGLGCRHVVIPRKNCYLAVDDTSREARLRGTGLILFCANLASECLIARLHRQNPVATYVDCGHIFDPLVGIRSRKYLRHDEGGILAVLGSTYAPLIFNRTRVVR